MRGNPRIGRLPAASFWDDQVGRRLRDSIVQLSSILNCRLQANHLLRRYLDLGVAPLNTDDSGVR